MYETQSMSLRIQLPSRRALKIPPSIKAATRSSACYEIRFRLRAREMFKRVIAIAFLGALAVLSSAAPAPAADAMVITGSLVTTDNAMINSRDSPETDMMGGNGGCGDGCNDGCGDGCDNGCGDGCDNGCGDE
ncbi:hypothetical protein NEOLEDRAFT_1129543 [Neolentinus lepideus HHB14362 ss-1]|uniref:Uncharacterized protein n=1 Tax=Neolentinus lepideus HHB14362 ss-1 TaxID=1314782 RepID=A0A165UIH3_9AGAM|nr:hypothetical protein NEOLEDRAFT_1129543 [Neolentinus lepideus HHB14362 ss-1]